MENQSRIKNSFRNLTYGVFFQLITTILSFINRTVFINTLGVEYLGINGLFSNILSVISLAELGLQNIVVYSLYKPLSNNDKHKVAALINFYKRIYHYIALFMAITGIMLIPFLHILVKTDVNIEGLKIYYLLFLANSVVSYMFIYKSSIINADQKQYLISKYNIVFKLLLSILQICILIVLKNYILYLLIQVIFTFLNNIYISKKANEHYPYIKEKYVLIKSEKEKIFKDVKSMFSYKLGGVLLNSTDNIFISALKGTKLVGYYSNYLMIISVINMFINMIYDSIYNSIGNFNANANYKRKKEIFDVTLLLYMWIGGLCFIGLYLLLNDVITIWLGSEFLIDKNTIGIIVLNFYLPIILYPIWSFRNTTGLFKETKYILTFTAIINLILSYILGNKYGLIGILLSTSIARLLTSFWYEPYILYKKVFKSCGSQYFIKQIVNLFIVIFNIYICSLVFNIFKGINITNLLLKTLIVIIISNINFYIIYRNTKEFKYIFKNIILKIINKEYKEKIRKKAE